MTRVFTTRLLGEELTQLVEVVPMRWPGDTEPVTIRLTWGRVSDHDPADWRWEVQHAEAVVELHGGGWQVANFYSREQVAQEAHLEWVRKTAEAVRPKEGQA